MVTSYLKPVLTLKKSKNGGICVKTISTNKVAFMPEILKRVSIAVNFTQLNHSAHVQRSSDLWNGF